MDVKDLLELVNGYNAKKTELFDHCADLLLTEIRNSLETIYNNGSWAQLVDVEQFGFSIRNIRPDFQQFEIDIGGYPMRFGETISKDYNLQTMQEFFDSADFTGKEINGFVDKDILQLKSLCDALERKGIETYADPDNGQMVVAFTVK